MPLDIVFLPIWLDANLKQIGAMTYTDCVGSFNPRRAGGWGRLDAPLQVFRISDKKTARGAAIFGIPFYTSFLHPSWKFQLQVISGQVTRPGQVTQPPKLFVIALWL